MCLGLALERLKFPWKNEKGKLANVSATAGTADLLGWWTGIAAADLDGDGDMDVVSTAWGAESGRIVWFEQRVGTNGQPEWKLYDLKNPWPKANSVVLVDLDQDGRLDIAATAERGANEFRWWRNASGIEE